MPDIGQPWPLPPNLSLFFHIDTAHAQGHIQTPTIILTNFAQLSALVLKP